MPQQAINASNPEKEAQRRGVAVVGAEGRIHGVGHLDTMKRQASLFLLQLPEWRAQYGDFARTFIETYHTQVCQPR